MQWILKTKRKIGINLYEFFKKISPLKYYYYYYYCWSSLRSSTPVVHFCGGILEFSTSRLNLKFRKCPNAYLYFYWQAHQSSRDLRKLIFFHCLLRRKKMNVSHRIWQWFWYCHCFYAEWRHWQHSAMTTWSPNWRFSWVVQKTSFRRFSRWIKLTKAT